METIQRRDNDSSIMAESESQLELHDETDVANQEGKECYKGLRTVDRVHACVAKQWRVYIVKLYLYL